ncbi:hypothetical protein LTR37_012904 [Vermiconidia calcicola]|uniref:Uncharacterized protein n=1 Tax=Vermiconidia calcicola TaxID=1690605 RepID=A0ACC3MY71_9PEZI|nr:hypothetical protein LTR37_012904 [Vermiconidia calcicola]
MSLSKWLGKFVTRTQWSPLRFPSNGFKVFGNDVWLDEEYLDAFAKGVYYPIKLGEVLVTRYQVVGKLGFGTSSTVWLARDMHALDIKGDNILQEIEDNSILEDFVQDELEHPAPRNFVAGKTIYATRLFNLPKEFGAAVLSDFGSAERGDEVRHRNAQPEVYRSPEVMLKADWSYPVDIWNVGVMIWDLFEDKHMFYGEDPDGKGYSTRAHLADIISLLGPPPHDLLERGRRVKEFFDEKGQFIADVPVPKNSLEQSDENLEGDNKKAFLEFMRCMLQWRPEDRKTAKELLEHPWLKS